MPNCPKCGKPVYFAERKSSMGKEWHTYCFRCNNCNKSLTPGQHSEHLGQPFCNGCYQTLYGPDGFRPGTVEPRKVRVEENSQVVAGNQEIVAKIREYNLYKRSPYEKLKSREVNGKVLFEGIVKVYWGLKRAIVLARGVTYAKQRYNRESIYDFLNIDEAAYLVMLEEATKARTKRELFDSEKKRLKEISENSIQVSDADKVAYHVMLAEAAEKRKKREFFTTIELSESRREEELGELAVSYSEDYDPCFSLPSSLSSPSRPPLTSSLSMEMESSEDFSQNMTDGGSFSRSLGRTGSIYDSRRSQVRKRSASFRKISRQKKLEEAKDVEISERQRFTPPYGTPTNLRVASTLTTPEVIEQLFAKFKVENDPSEFGLYVIHDSGAQESCRDSDCPLMLRLKLGPNEDIAKIYILERKDAEEMEVSAEAAEWIKFALPELNIFCKKFAEEENREVTKVKQRFLPWREAIEEQIEETKRNDGKIETDL